MDLVKMRLLKRHTHKGMDLQPPAVIEVPSSKVNWLVEQGIAEKAGLEEFDRKRGK